MARLLPRLCENFSAHFLNVEGGEAIVACTPRRDLRGADRSEVQLLPPCLDDSVADNAPARFIDAYVEGLGFAALGFTHARPRDTGRLKVPSLSRGRLIIRRICSSSTSTAICMACAGALRAVEGFEPPPGGRGGAQSRSGLAALPCAQPNGLRGLRPDFKTIADFRRDNRAAFKPLLRHFNLLCRSLDLFGAELVAIDGAKFKASNNTRRHYTAEQLRELLAKVEARIDEYLGEMAAQAAPAEGAPAAPGPHSSEALEEKIALLRERRGRYDGRPFGHELRAEWLSEIVQSGENEVSLTDADSRKMKGAHGEHFIGDNVQVAVDARHDLIVSEDVVQAANDRGQLGALAVAAKEELRVETPFGGAQGTRPRPWPTRAITNPVSSRRASRPAWRASCPSRSAPAARDRAGGRFFQSKPSATTRRPTRITVRAARCCRAPRSTRTTAASASSTPTGPRAARARCAASAPPRAGG